MKKIAFVGAYSKPELISSSHLTIDIISECQKAGLETMFISPNQVRGLSKEDVKKYKPTRTQNDEYGKHVIIRCPSSMERSFLPRLFRYKIFGKQAVKFLKKDFHPDYIFLWSYPPLGLSKTIVKYAKRHNTKIIYDVHDIQPDILSINGLLRKIIRQDSNFVLKNSDYVFTLSEDMKDTLCNKGVSNSCISVIPPWDYKYELQSVDNKILDHLNVGSNFVVGYVGNIGNFQNVELLLKIATKMKDYKDIKFLFVGGGSLSNMVREYAEKHENIQYFPKVSENEAANLYMFCDLNVISLKKGLIKFCCPSKTPMILKSTSNILAIADESKFVNELKTNNAICITNYEENAIIEAILSCFKHNQKRLVKQTAFSRDNCINKWYTFFKSLNDGKNN